MTCLLCGGSFPVCEILVDVREEGPDVGPVCVHCYSDLTAVATGQPFALQRLRANVRLPAKPPIKAELKTVRLSAKSPIKLPAKPPIKAELKTVVIPPPARRRTFGPGLVEEL